MLIGDRVLDIIAGRRAGVRTCFFGEMVDGGGADLVITGYDRLLRRLERQYHVDGCPASSCPAM
jgi:phosphoglycolate phosphatase-like HAD superfamily hydrolase